MIHIFTDLPFYFPMHFWLTKHEGYMYIKYDQIVQIVARNAYKAVDCMFGNYKPVCLFAGKKKVGNSDHFPPSKLSPIYN